MPLNTINWIIAWGFCPSCYFHLLNGVFSLEKHSQNKESAEKQSMFLGHGA